MIIGSFLSAIATVFYSPEIPFRFPITLPILSISFFVAGFASAFVLIPSVPEILW